MFSIRTFLKTSFIKSDNLVGLPCNKCGYLIHYNVLCTSHNVFKSFNRGLREMRGNVREPQADVRFDEKPLTKILKISIIGTPNSGKSTFINQIIGRRVFAISSKVHTTRVRARAVMNLDNTQIVFLDTPGLVTQEELKKHHLENSFLRDGELAMTEANVVGVIHDVSNSWTRGRLDPKVLRLLHLYPWKHTVLILNKVDVVKKKRYLLELADRLTYKTLVDPDTNKSKQLKDLSEDEVMKELKRQTGWPNFSQVFMVSALEGTGVSEVMEYLLPYAQTGPWMFSEPSFTDQKPEKVIVDTVKAQLLDQLPKEIPYNIQVQMELYNELRDGTIMAVVLIICPNIRSEKMVMTKVREIAQLVEAKLRNTFQTQVLVKLVIQTIDS